MRLASRMRGESAANNARGLLWCVGRKLPQAPLIETRPDWEQADPAWIRGALRHARDLPSGGWYVLGATSELGARPRCCEVAGRTLVVWQAADQWLAAPCTCPHFGASLAGAR